MILNAQKTLIYVKLQPTLRRTRYFLTTGGGNQPVTSWKRVNLLQWVNYCKFLSSWFSLWSFFHRVYL